MRGCFGGLFVVFVSLFGCRGLCCLVDVNVL